MLKKTDEKYVRFAFGIGVINMEKNLIVQKINKVIRKAIEKLEKIDFEQNIVKIDKMQADEFQSKFTALLARPYDDKIFEDMIKARNQLKNNSVSKAFLEALQNDELYAMDTNSMLNAYECNGLLSMVNEGCSDYKEYFIKNLKKILSPQNL